METLTVYSAVDGAIKHQEAALTWHNLVIAAGSGVDQAATQEWVLLLMGEDTEDQWQDLRRGIFVFPTGALGATANIISAIFTLYGYGKNDALSATPDINIYSAAPANEALLAAGDFNSLGNTPLCDTPVTYAGFNIGDPGDPNNFILNAAGLAYINKTGNTCIGTRNANYDVADELDPNNHDPAWVSHAYSGIRPWMTEKGAGYQPKLVISYTVAAVGRSHGYIIG